MRIGHVIVVSKSRSTHAKGRSLARTATILVGAVGLATFGLTALSAQAGPRGGAPPGHHRHRVPWQRSYVSRSERTIRLALTLGDGTRPVRADVRYMVHVLRIGVVADVPTGPTTSIGYLQCVELRVKFRTRGRHLIDTTTGRAPDRSQQDAATREDSRSVDLRGPCRRLTVAYAR